MKRGKDTDHLMSSSENKRRLNDAAAEIGAEVAARRATPSATAKTNDQAGRIDDMTATLKKQNR